MDKVQLVQGCRSTNDVRYFLRFSRHYRSHAPNSNLHNKHTKHLHAVFINSGHPGANSGQIS